MSALLMDEGFFTANYVPNHNRSRVLKSRENISKLKCTKLKKKLKKYKLRKDGQEDPDIIDVSQTLISSLKIKSPNNQHFSSHIVSEENRPHNYLTKMVRCKKSVTVVESIPVNVQKFNSEIVDSISQTSKIDKDKKQTDAFKLLMESRNKSIGNNSPGKDNCEEDTVIQERAQNKELRAKRILSLNRMAQAKGSLKKLEIEEYREENIKRKMESRAKKLKSMIEGGKNRNKDQFTSFRDKCAEKSSNSNISVAVENKETLGNEVFKTFDLFKDTKVNLNSTVKQISKEDEEFLKKLSPSIRKKENMLCYFQKVDKDSDTLQGDDNNSSQNGQLVIKVKLKSRSNATKNKNRSNTDKVSKSTNDHEHEQEKSMVIQEVQLSTSDSHDNSKKRKRNENIEKVYEDLTNNDVSGTMQCHNDSRPKRNTKKPVKYGDDFQLTSSDEELHIFTPKKKRKGKFECERISKQDIDKNKDQDRITDCDIQKAKNIKTKKCKDIIKEKDIKKNPPKNEDNRNSFTKKATKLAPIFVSKPLIDSAAIEAKQKFLQSGVPSQLKKVITHSNIMASDEFQKVVHIQGLSDMDIPIISPISNASNIIYDEDFNLKEEKDLFKQLLHSPMIDNYSMPKLQKNVNSILKDIKQSYPRFPVYRTYHLLRGKSKGEFKDCIYPDLDNSVEIFNNMVDINNIQPDKLYWADKYKPITEKQVIGNFESIRQLKRWLVAWTENDAKSKKTCPGSDSSDFYQSETDSRDAKRNENNLLIITGKVGTGKTLSVYAVAAELAIKVIEVNASTKRTGKIMLQDLQEATQSHKVDRAKTGNEYSEKQDSVMTNNIFKSAKKRGRKKKAKVDSGTEATNIRKESAELTVSQDNARTGMSLILIDDADIVFDQDDGFCYAISQLIQSSKRPVILVTSSLSCPHLLKFVSYAKIIKMRPFLPRMLGTWLDIMCLVDINMCSPGLGAKVLDLFKGDIRRTINYLQFYMTSHKYLTTMDNPGVIEDEDISKVIADDENSCMSWGDTEGWEDKNIRMSNSNNIPCGHKKNESDSLEFMSPLNNFYFWWNMPNLINYSPKPCDNKFENISKVDKIKETKELNAISSVLDHLSVTDCFGAMNEEHNVTCGPWRSFEIDNVIDNENFTTYNKNIDYMNEISSVLMLKSIAEAQRVLDAENKTEVNYPSMSFQRDRERVMSRHKTLTSYLNLSTALDRRAVAMDYWASCRSICRIEKSKTNSNSKRNNRFCHYLKSLNIVCKNEYFDNLGESLCFKK